MLIIFWCDSDNKNLYFFYFLGHFSFAHFGYYQNLVIWSYTLKCYLLGMLAGPE